MSSLLPRRSSNQTINNHNQQVTLSLTSGSLMAGTTSLYCRFGEDGAAVAAAVSFENSGAKVKCAAPAGAAGTSVPVQLSYDGLQFVGTSESLFWYFTTPDPTKITPSFGSQLGGTAVTVTFDGGAGARGNGDPLAKMEAQVGAARRGAAAADHAVCRFNGPNGAETTSGVTRYTTRDTGEFCVVCLAPSRGKAGGRDRVRLEVSLDGGATWSAETEYFEYADTAFYGITGLDGSEFAGSVDALATEHLPGGTGKLCATQIKPSNGPSSGGTTVTVTAQGGLPKAHAEVFCYFGTTVNKFVYASSETHDATGSGTIVAECAAPAGTALTTTFVAISPDGFTAPTAGADFHYHEPILETNGDTRTADPKGGTSVTFSLITDPLPSTGVDADEVVAACRFGSATWSDAKTVAGVYTAGSGSLSKGKIVCTAPGFEGVKAHFAVPVYVSLNGGKDFGTGISRTFTYKTDDIRGILANVGSWDGPTAAQIVASTAVSALAYKAIPAATTGACTSWSQDHYATVSEVNAYGVVAFPDGSKVHVPATSVTKTADEAYAVVVPAEATAVALSLKLSDSMATAVFSGAAVPRRYDTADTPAATQITAGFVENVAAVTLNYGGFSAESAALASGSNALTFDVVAADDTTTRQYDLTVTRSPGRNYAALASIPKLAETNFEYALEFNSVASAALSGRSFYGISFPEAFEAEAYYGYSTEVRADAPTLDITALPTDAYATVRMRSYGANGATTTTPNWVAATAAAGAKSNARTATVGLVTAQISTVEVEVTAQDGTTTAVYFLEVTRSLISSNARLSNVLLVGEGDRLTCAGECLENWPLVTVPAMDPSAATREFKIIAASSLMKAKINPVADGQRYKTMTVTNAVDNSVQDITSTGITTLYTLTGNADTSYINTAETTTTFTITITAEDAVTVETYTIVVVRPAASTDATLTKMFTEASSFSGYYGHMVPTFDGRNASIGTSNVMYKTEMPYSLTTIQLRALAASPKTYTIVVTANDPVTSFGTADANRTVASNSTLAYMVRGGAGLITCCVTSRHNLYFYSPTCKCYVHCVCNPRSASKELSNVL